MELGTKAQEQLPVPFLEAPVFAAPLWDHPLETQSPSDQDNWPGVFTALQGYGSSQ